MGRGMSVSSHKVMRRAWYKVEEGMSLRHQQTKLLNLGAGRQASAASLPAKHAAAETKVHVLNSNGEWGGGSHAITVSVWLADVITSIRSRGGPTAEDRWKSPTRPRSARGGSNAVRTECVANHRRPSVPLVAFEIQERIVLHFEHLRCDGRPLCTQAGCLQQISLLTGWPLSAF